MIQLLTLLQPRYLEEQNLFRDNHILLLDNIKTYTNLHLISVLEASISNKITTFLYYLSINASPGHETSYIIEL
jgi:hypothetical protein